jgi:hypothetical protein
MNNLSGFLQKFKKIIGDKREENARISKVLVMICGVKIPPEKIDVREGVLYLSVRPVERTEVVLRKAEILTYLNEIGISMKDLR